MKILSLCLLVLGSVNLGFSHDEGHGPTVKDASLHGGKISAVVDAAQVESGKSAILLYKGELVHQSKNLDVIFYILDKDMKAVDLSLFDKKVSGVQVERKGKSEFELNLDPSGKFYTGKRPKNKRVPFTLELKFSDGNRKLFSAFEKLD